MAVHWHVQAARKPTCFLGKARGQDRGEGVSCANTWPLEQQQVWACSMRLLGTAALCPALCCCCSVVGVTVGGSHIILLCPCLTLGTQIEPDKYCPHHPQGDSGTM